MSTDPLSRLTDVEWLEELRNRLGRLLAQTENHIPENGPGTYPPEVLMTLRLAYTTACRAVTQEKEAESAPFFAPNDVIIAGVEQQT